MKLGRCVFLAIFIVVALSVPVLGAPWLTCDPYPKTGEQPDNFEVTITPLAPFLVSPTVNADGSVVLLYDLGALAALGAGAHTASAIALKAGWRTGASNSVPFTKPSIAPPILSIVATPGAKQ